MTAPTSWLTPSSGSTATKNEWYYQPITHVGGYWFCLSTSTDPTASVVLRYATDPTGAWSTATLPSAPGGYTVGLAQGSGVVHDGTTFAFHLYYTNGAAMKCRVIHATTPGGTWTAYEYDAGDVYRGFDMTYGDGKFVIVGTYTTPNPDEAFIAYCTTANGTYTFGSGNTATGYSPGSGVYTIRSIGFDGTTWVTGARRVSTFALQARYSTTLTSGWAAPSSITLTGTPDRIVYHANGWWTIHSGQTDFLYTDTPSGTWTLLTTSDHGFDTYAGDITWGDGYWVTVGSDAVAPSDQIPLISYLASAGSPAGTYTAATTDWSTPARDVYGTSVAFASSVLVAASSYNGELRYCSLAAASRRYLRQRQSPASNPTRVRQVPSLRQHQRFL